MQDWKIDPAQVSWFRSATMSDSAITCAYTTLLNVLLQSHLNITVSDELKHLKGRFKVQGSLLFVTYTIIQSIINSEMQVELKKNTAWHEESEEKKNNPQTMLLGEYSVRTGKTPQQHKSTYTMT